MSGDPVWLIPIAPPGGGKTELLQPLCGLPNVHPAATLTEAALLSGSPNRERARDAHGGLLRSMGDFGIILCKDFTSVLSMDHNVRAPLLAALREIYDGEWTRHVGTDGGKTLHWKGKAGLIAGCTPTIDSQHGVMSAMGERFLLYRMPEIDADELADRALSHPGGQKKMRQELAGAVSSFFSDLNVPALPPALTAEEKGFLIALSTLVVRCRSAVERDAYSREIDLVSDPEAPGRLALGLAQLLAGLKVIGVTDAERIRIIRKTGLDCIPALRFRVLSLLADERRSMSTSEIGTRINHPTATTRRACEDLNAHRLLTKLASGHGRADGWEIAEWAEMRLRAVQGAFPKNERRLFGSFPDLIILCLQKRYLAATL